MMVRMGLAMMEMSGGRKHTESGGHRGGIRSEATTVSSLCLSNNVIATLFRFVPNRVDATDW